VAVSTSASADPLPSWNATAAEAAIIAFVERVTDRESEHYVPEADRVAVFDNDGTLWSEKPAYFQLLFAIDRLREKAEADPSVLASDVLRAADQGDWAGVAAGGMKGLVELTNVSHAGMSVEAFQEDARAWLDEARHPTSGLRYVDMTYQPMVELLRYLRDEGFTTYVVSGGGQDFVRAFAEGAYGIPPNQVVGSEGNKKYEVGADGPVVMKEDGIFFVDDGAGKPVGISRYIGKRPIFVAGNSDGDFQMLEWATAGDGPRLGLIVHHTDAEREFAYDRESHIGRLAEGLDQAGKRGWVVVDMARDWDRIWTGQR
jgi:phosphoglycolate phosphatase-like HAD superfamily hydrolase